MRQNTLRTNTRTHLLTHNHSHTDINTNKHTPSHYHLGQQLTRAGATSISQILVKVGRGPGLGASNQRIVWPELRRVPLQIHNHVT